MKRFPICVLGLMLGLAVAACLAPLAACDARREVAQPNIVETAQQSYVGIARTLDGGVGGSGVCVQFLNRRCVLTAAHCVEEGKDTLVVVAREKRSEHKVIASDAKMDLAVLDAPDLDRLYVYHYTIGVNVGEDAVHVSTPGGVEGSLGKGYVSKAEFDHPYTRIFVLVTGRAYAGDSGSGVFVLRNGRPHLAGIAVITVWRGGPLGVVCGESIVTFLKTHMGPSDAP